MKTLCNCLKVCFLLIVSSFFQYSLADDRPMKEWIIMVYMDIDNNLEPNGLLDLIEMEHGITDDVDIYVMVDRSKGYTTAVGNWDSTRIYRINKTKNKINNLKELYNPYSPSWPQDLSSELLTDMGELNMSDPNIMAIFIKNVAQSFRAKRYAFIAWDHGNGWQGLMQDENTGKGANDTNVMSLGKFAEGLRKGAAYLPKKKFDLMLLDLCLMGQLDVLHSIKDFSDYLIAYSSYEPSGGRDYSQTLQFFNPSLSTKDTAVSIAKFDANYYENFPLINEAYSVYDLSKTTDTVNAYNEFLNKLVSTDFDVVNFSKAVRYALHYGNQDEFIGGGQGDLHFIDLPDFIKRLESKVSNLPQKELNSLKENINKLIVYNYSNGIYSHSGGLSVYMPLRNKDFNNEYAQTDFFKNTKLEKFFTTFYNKQQELTNKQPQIYGIEIGTLPSQSNNNIGLKDISLNPLDSVMPFSHNVIRFHVDGKGILSTIMYQTTKLSDAEERIDYLTLVREWNNSEAYKDDAASVLDRVTPDYVDGDNVFIRELDGIRYKVSNGQGSSEPITVNLVNNYQTLTVARERIIETQGLYHDPLDNKDYKVRAFFKETSRELFLMQAIVDTTFGAPTLQEIPCRTGGSFRPTTMVSSNGGIREVAGNPIIIGNSPLTLIPDFLENNSIVKYYISVDALSGKVNAESPISKFKLSNGQQSFLNNTNLYYQTSVDDVYSMVWYDTRYENPLIVPTFNLLEIKSVAGRYLWSLDADSSDDKILKINIGGIPEFVLLENDNDSKVQSVSASWYVFLEGNKSSGNHKWHVVSEGDGKRWTLIPLNQLPKDINGVYVSDTERWIFDHGKFTLTRENQTIEGTYSISGNTMSVSNLPFDKYAFYISSDQKTLNLLSNKKIASFLTREENSSTQSIDETNANNEIISKNNENIEGFWLYGNTSMNIVRNPQKNTYNMNLQQNGKVLRATFIAKNNQLYITFEDNHNEIWPYKFENQNLIFTLNNMEYPFKRVK